MTWIQNQPAWLEVRKADISLFTPHKHLHEGEHEAIALVLELNADAFLSDDSNAIKETRRLNILTLRLFNILESAAEDELLDLSEALGKIKLTTFHLPPIEIIDAMLERDRQRKLSAT